MQQEHHDDKKLEAHEVTFWRIGDVTVTRIEEFSSPGYSPFLQFPDYDASIFDEFPELRDMDKLDPQTGRTFASIHSWLVRTGNEIILVDTATGNKKPRIDPKFERFHMLDSPAYLKNLAKTGVRPEDVTIVVNTHMHVDHSGWNTVLESNRWVPTFPNARYVFGRDEYANWQPGGVTAIAQPEGIPVIEDSITPIVEAGLVEWVGNGEELIPGITFHAAPGHTSGQLIMQVESAGDTAIFTGDCMHRAMQVYRPTLNCFLCENNDLAPVTRKMILERSATRKAMIFPAHFGAPHAGRIEHRDAAKGAGGGYCFEPILPTR